MNQTNLRVFNFTLIFSLSLLTAYFTLENTEATIINIFPGVSLSIPIASLVILSAGLGACLAWSFASWSDKVRAYEMKELEDTKNFLKELETDFKRLKSTNTNAITQITSSDEKILTK